MKTRTIIVSAVSALLIAAAALFGLNALPLRGAQPAQAQAQPTVRPAAADAVEVMKDPTDLPPPIARSTPEHHDLHITTREVNGVLEDGTTYTYWTFDGTVPGPLLRVRVGDTVTLHLSNDASSTAPHSIDLHAVTGPGGGAVATQVAPGETKQFTFKAMNEGVYVYHCATPHIPTHISNGMYGLIVVEPEEGLAPVDREFYVMQGDIYTQQARGTKGHLALSSSAMRDERPTFVVFNGKAAGLTGDNAMRAKVGERVRIFVGVGGPNVASNFHVIGEIFDTVHAEGASEGTSNVQTTLIPAGGAAWVEFTIDVPGTYTLVDHALSRALDKGAVAQIVAEGEANPEVFDVPVGQQMSSH
ncbi:MAG TPA: copper-containing nitrite reductase [Roseiflexaceae bacterium]|nr:copper-containing nitrite reductase [Roseiflexaceae bacterium]